MSDVPDYAHMTVEELEAIAQEAIAKRKAEGRPPTLLGERAARTVGTVPISLRMPATVLATLKREAEARDMPYQRLLMKLVEQGLEQLAPPAARVRHPSSSALRSAKRRAS
jgi:CopG antitoxin of type II toxin-antitoxin system